MAVKHRYGNIFECLYSDKYFIDETTLKKHFGKKHRDEIFFNECDSDNDSDSDIDETCIGCRNGFVDLDKLENHKCYKNNRGIRYLEKNNIVEFWKKYKGEEYWERMDRIGSISEKDEDNEPALKSYLNKMRRKPVLQLDLNTGEVIKEYAHMAEANLAMGVCSRQNDIRLVCQGKKPSDIGFGMRFMEDYEREMREESSCSC